MPCFERQGTPLRRGQTNTPPVVAFHEAKLVFAVRPHAGDSWQNGLPQTWGNQQSICLPTFCGILLVFSFCPTLPWKTRVFNLNLDIPS